MVGDGVLEFVQNVLQVIKKVVRRQCSCWTKSKKILRNELFVLKRQKHCYELTPGLRALLLFAFLQQYLLV